MMLSASRSRGGGGALLVGRRSTIQHRHHVPSIVPILRRHPMIPTASVISFRASSSTSSHHHHPSTRRRQQQQQQYQYQQARRSLSSSLNEPTLFPPILGGSNNNNNNNTTPILPPIVVDDNNTKILLSSSADNINNYDHLLRSDVRTMGSLLGEAISSHHGQEILVKVEKMRQMAKESRAAAASTAATTATNSSSTEKNDAAAERLSPMIEYVRQLTPQEIGIISRAFAHFLGVANAAEAHQRCRRLKMDLAKEGSSSSNSMGNNYLGALHETKRDSTAGVLSQFLNGRGDNNNNSNTVVVSKEAL